MSLFAILLGGDLEPTPRLRSILSGARVVAADSGMRHAEALGVVPELWVGDFDSVTPQLKERYPDVPVETWPADKDRTDGEIAILAALQRGATQFLIVGAFGGPRADHAFLHLAAALGLAEAGYETILSSGDQEGRPLIGSTTFDYGVGTLFSILCFSDLEGLTVSGAKWPLDRVAVPFGSSLTLSNEVSDTLSVSLEKGRAVLVAHPAAGDA